MKKLSSTETELKKALLIKNGVFLTEIVTALTTDIFSICRENYKSL